MASGLIQKQTDLLVEESNVTFANGIYKLSAKSGYTLVNAYIVNRSDSERNTYAIVSIQRNTDESYNLLNNNTTLSAGIRLLMVWLRTA